MIFRALTLQEANVFLPLIQDHFARIHRLVAEGQILQESLPKDTAQAAEQGASISYHSVSAVSEMAEKAPKKRTRNTVKQKEKRLKEIEIEIRNEVLEMHCYGAIVKSVFPARVDFLSELHRQPIYLCWQAGDKTVSHWHPIDEGFSSRRPIHHPPSFGPVVSH